MASKRWSEFDSVAGTILASDVAVLSRSGQNYKFTMADLISGLLEVGEGWTLDLLRTWVYVSATSFKIVGADVTTKFPKGTRIRLKQGGSYKYFVVTAATFSTDTTVTITGGDDYTLANSAITDNYYSYAANPQGYPGWFNFAPNKTGWSSTTSNEGSLYIIGNKMTLRYYIQGTSNSTAVQITPPVPIQSSHTWIGWFQDNSVNVVGRIYGGGPLIFGPGINTDAWTASGTKLVACTLEVLI